MTGSRIVIFGWAESAHIQRWARALAGRGYEIRVISLGGEPIPGIDTVVMRGRGLAGYLRNASRAAKSAMDFKPDLIHVHYAGGFGYWGRKIDFSPTLVSVWGADVIDLPKRFIPGRIVRNSLKKSSWISATSKMLKQTCAELVPGIESKVTVIPFGVDLPAETVPAPPRPPFKLCFIKAHRRKYGPDILLRAISAVAGKVPDIELSMAGQGEMTEELRGLARSLGIDKRVRFVGYIPNDGIYEFIQDHHVMVMPSVMKSESFGVAVLEASACARPVIASRVGGVPEVLLDGVNGILVSPSDADELAEAIIRLAGDADLRDRMGQAGYQFVRENYEWSFCVDQMEALYDRLIDEERTHTAI